MSEPSQTRRHLIRLLWGLASLAVLAISLWALARRVEDPFWPTAAAVLDGRVAADELVVMLPPSVELEARHFRGLPVAAGLPNRLDDFPGLWIVAGERHLPARIEWLQTRFRAHEELSVEGGRVMHVTEPRPVAFDLEQSFRAARVERVPAEGGEPIVCTGRRGRRRRCPGPDWRDVGPHEVKVDGAPFEGLWLHPLAGEVTRVRFSDVPAKGDLVLRLVLDDGARRERADAARGPIDVAVRYDGRPMATRSLWPEDRMVTVVLPLPGATDGVGELVLETTAKDDYYANLAVAGEVLQ